MLKQLLEEIKSEHNIHYTLFKNVDANVYTDDHFICSVHTKLINGTIVYYLVEKAAIEGIKFTREYKLIDTEHIKTLIKARL